MVKVAASALGVPLRKFLARTGKLNDVLEGNVGSLNHFEKMISVLWGLNPVLTYTNQKTLCTFLPPFNGTKRISTWLGKGLPVGYKFASL